MSYIYPFCTRKVVTMVRKSYNERLFSGVVRKYAHEARFNWLNKKLLEYDVCYDLVIELGCFDGRSIQYFPEEPARYYGFDAGWEGGIYRAIEKYHDNPRFIFYISSSPADLAIPDGMKATLVIALETLEHIPPDILDEYLQKIYELMAPNSYFIITVPNEKGIVFLSKFLVKALAYRDAHNISLREVYAATFGKTHLIKRDNHKGFDWECLLDQLKQYYKIVELQGVQIKKLSPKLNINIGIVCQK